MEKSFNEEISEISDIYLLSTMDLTLVDNLRQIYIFKLTVAAE